MGRKFTIAALLSLGLAAQGCAAGDTTDGVDQQTGDLNQQVCVPNQQIEYACSGGGTGIQICSADGSAFSACDQCTSPPIGGGGAGGGEPTGPCGDGVCADDESCHTCTKDCGVCDPCDIAPKCENVQIPSGNLTHAPDFDVPKMTFMTVEARKARLQAFVAEGGTGMRVLAAALDTHQRWNEHPYTSALRELFEAHPEQAAELSQQLDQAGMGTAADYRYEHPDPTVEPVNQQPKDVVPPGGTVECGAPMLRLNIAKITVHEEDDDWANDIVYCVVQAEAATGAEVRVTPKTPNLDEGESYTFALGDSVFWGQQEPKSPAGNMLITYDCIEADSTTGYQDLIDGIGGAAGQIGNVVEGDNGWIFTAVSAIAPIVSTGLGLNTDDQLFHAQQTIPLDKQLELTNGRFWTVRREGTHNLSDWDWELTINAWGCAEYGTL